MRAEVALGVANGACISKKQKGSREAHTEKGHTRSQEQPEGLSADISLCFCVPVFRKTLLDLSEKTIL